MLRFFEVKRQNRNTERALDLFEDAYKERDPFVLGAPVHSLLAGLRGHPRFEAVVARLWALRGAGRRPVRRLTTAAAVRDSPLS